MSPEFRERVFTPAVLPLTVIGVILAYALALSRVLLAVPEVVSTITGITVASYILLVAALVAARPRISSRALGVGLVLGFAGVLAAGAVAGAAGIRQLETEEVAVEAEGTPEGGGGAESGGQAATIPEGALIFRADASLQFTEASTTATAGEATIALENPSGLVHNVTFENINNEEPVVEVVNGVEVGTVTLQPGTITYYCSVPGHREAGMEGQLSVS